MHFAYYTSATTGLNILHGRSLWMRSAACMNDYREIDYGIQLINSAVQGSARRQAQMKRIAQQLGWGENMIGSILADLNRNERKFTTHTYLACVSEHDFEGDAKGRLSMWRAYGRKTGVAFMSQLAKDYSNEWERGNANTLLLNDATLDAIANGVCLLPVAFRHRLENVMSASLSTMQRTAPAVFVPESVTSPVSVSRALEPS